MANHPDAVARLVEKLKKRAWQRGDVHAADAAQLIEAGAALAAEVKECPTGFPRGEEPWIQFVHRLDVLVDAWDRAVAALGE